MKLLGGLQRDTLPENQPSGSWRYALNAMYNKAGDALRNEPGLLDKYTLDLDVIGIITIENSYIVFSTNNTTSEIGIVDVDETYTILIRSLYLGFKKDNPIAGVCKRNSNNERIVVFSDATQEYEVVDANVPRVLNIDNFGFDVDTTTHEFLDASYVDRLKLFADYKTPTYELVGIDRGGILKTGVYFFSAQYVFDDLYASNCIGLSSEVVISGIDTRGTFYEITGLPGGTTSDSVIKFDVLNLDEQFTSYYIVIVSVINEIISARRIGPFPIGINHITYSGYEASAELSLQEVFATRVIYDRIKTMVPINNSLYIGNLHTPEVIKYQKFANNIEVKWCATNKTTLDSTEGSYADAKMIYYSKAFMPNEVYALYCRLGLKDGTISEWFHIPGRTANRTEREPVTDERNTYIHPNAKVFHVEDTSGISGDPADKTGAMGYWENETEQYPDDEEYNGTKDYSNVPMSGFNNKNEPVRHHKFPSISALQSNDILVFDTNSDNSIVNGSINFGDAYAYGAGDLKEAYLCFNSGSAAYGSGSFDDKNRIFTANKACNLVCNYHVKLDYRKPPNGNGHFSFILYKHEASTGIVTNYVDIADSTAEITGENLAISLEIGDKLGVYGVFTLTNVFGNKIQVESIIFDSYVRGVAKGSSANGTMFGHILGIELNNIVIPDYLRAKVQYIQIGFASRDIGNAQILGNGVLTTKEDLSVYEGRMYNFDILKNRPILSSVTHIQQHIIYNNDVVSPYTLQLGLSPNHDRWYPIKQIKYLAKDLAWATPNNEGQEECIYIHTTDSVDIGDGIPDTPMALTNEYPVIVDICTFKPNVYLSFLQQNVIPMGRVIPITQETTTVKSLYGGDVIYGLYGFMTYMVNKENIIIPPVDNNPSTAVISEGETDRDPDWIRYYLLPIFSISNLYFRIESTTNLEETFFPKYSYNTNAAYVPGDSPFWTYHQLDDSDSSRYHMLTLLNPGVVGAFSLTEWYSYDKSLHKKYDINPQFIYNPSYEYVNKYPYRIAKSLVQSLDSIEFSWRVFMPIDFVEQPKHRGPLWVLETDGTNLYIFHKYATFVARGSQLLKINENVLASLGSAEILDTRPEEIFYDKNGYIGNQCQFATMSTKHGILTIDRYRGKIFLISTKEVKEISAVGMQKFFTSNCNYNEANCNDGTYIFDDLQPILFGDGDTVIYRDSKYTSNLCDAIDNPFYGRGYTAAYDEENERFIITKQDDFLGLSGVNGQYPEDLSLTLSFAPLVGKSGQWVSFHDYRQHMLFNTRDKLLSVWNKHIYEHNDGAIGDYYSFLPRFTDIGNLLLSTAWHTKPNPPFSFSADGITFASAVSGTFDLVKFVCFTAGKRYKLRLYIPSSTNVTTIAVYQGYATQVLIKNCTTVGYHTIEFLASQAELYINFIAAAGGGSAIIESLNVYSLKEVVYPTKGQFVIDVPFNGGNNIENLFEYFRFVTTAIEANGNRLYNEIFSTAVVYNHNQHSNIISLVPYRWADINKGGLIRNVNGGWEFNDFKDLLNDKTIPIIDMDKVDELNENTLLSANIYKNWYEKSLFIAIFVNIRLIYNNNSGYSFYVSDVSANSKIVVR